MFNYEKGLSKETIRILSEKFKLNQEAFRRPNELLVSVIFGVKRNLRSKDTLKKLATAYLS